MKSDVAVIAVAITHNTNYELLSHESVSLNVGSHYQLGAL